MEEFIASKYTCPGLSLEFISDLTDKKYMHNEK